MDGFLAVDKPRGWTSHDVVDRVRSILSIKKVGHTGTLDPMATGVLVLCLGRLTRLSSFLTVQDKGYLARIWLGVSTNTLDSEGRVTARSDCVPGDPEEIRKAIEGFVGQNRQTPPMFSARKISGRRLYRWAREDKEIARPSQIVNIYSIQIAQFDPPFLDLDVSCSKGTYIRVLAEDIGRELRCGGHLSGLRRTGVGSIGLDQCIAMDKIGEEGWEHHLIDPNRALGHLPLLRLAPEEARRFTHGNPISGLRPDMELDAEGSIRVVDVEGRLLGIGNWQMEDLVLKPIRVLRPYKPEMAV